jgi:hypothetical protein
MTQEAEPQITIISNRAAKPQAKTRTRRAKPAGPAASGVGAPDSDGIYDAEIVPEEQSPETLAIEPLAADAPLFDDDKPSKSAPKAGPPSLDEWQDFMGRIVVRTLTQGYVALLLRDVELSESELKSIELDKDDLKEIAGPFASLANKNKWARKHGREIIALSDSWEALLALGIWMRRVNKLARKYRTPKKQIQHSHGRQPEPDAMEGVINGNGRTGAYSEEGTHYVPFIPDNPGTG